MMLESQTLNPFTPLIKIHPHQNNWYRIQAKVHHKIETVEVNWNDVLNEIIDLKEVSRYFGVMIKVNKPHAAADALAIRLNGVSRVRFANDTREFDVISDLYIAQTTPPKAIK